MIVSFCTVVYWFLGISFVLLSCSYDLQSLTYEQSWGATPAFDRDPSLEPIQEYSDAPISSQSQGLVVAPPQNTLIITQTIQTTIEKLFAALMVQHRYQPKLQLHKCNLQILLQVRMQPLQFNERLLKVLGCMMISGYLVTFLDLALEGFNE